jgi:CRISPR-associated protein (TIGR02584 family)
LKIRNQKHEARNKSEILNLENNKQTPSFKSSPKCTDVLTPFSECFAFRFQPLEKCLILAAMRAISKTKVLIAVTGMSPAILTETVWALAQQEDPWIPDQVIAITTRTGKTAIEQLLLNGGGWARLRSALAKKGLPVTESMAFGASDSIRVIGDGSRDYEDIATPEESGIAADFLLGVLRQYTEQPDTEIMASIAGGRKTMSALMMSCISLLGRTQDRACHVLADDAFLAANRDFLFPANQREQNAAKVQLCEIPFVRVRGWYEKEFHKVPPSYMQLVNKVQGIAPAPANYPLLTLDAVKGSFLIDKQPVSLSNSEFALVYLMLCRIQRDELPASWYDFEDDFVDLLDREVATSVNWLHSLMEKGAPDPEDFRKWASSARSKLRKMFSDPDLTNLIFPSMKKKSSLVYPSKRISIKDVG